MIRCRTCLYPNTKPDLVFDKTGECSACSSYRKRQFTDWEAREKVLLQLLDEHHGECIVASSGGKDSHYIALKLLELRAHVTCVTATTCQLTEIGRSNIENLARFCKTVQITPSRTIRARLNRLGLTLVGDPSWPEHVSIFTTPFQMAEALGRHLIFYGENAQEAYGGPTGTDAAFELDARWRSEFGGFLGLRPSDMVGQDGITERDMQDYTLPPAGKAKAYFLGQFYEWDSHRNAQVAWDHGMRWTKPSAASWWSFENQDNLQTGIHDLMMFLKYGYGRGCAQVSVDIRGGWVTRDVALEWVEENDGRFPDPYLGQPISAVLDHIGMTRDDFDEICRRFSCSQPA